MSHAKTMDRAAIHHIAQLAALSLTDEESEHLAAELGAIVQYVEELLAVDTKDVPPTAEVQLGDAAWRPDEVVAGVSHEEALSQAPRVEHDGFAVPVFVEA